MANTKSAQKQIRQSAQKRAYNLFWKKRVKAVIKSINGALEQKDTKADILNKELIALQKVLDKAAKSKAIHQNKASRLKSRYAQKVSARTEKPAKAAKSS